MNDDRLTEALAAQILGWRVSPGRFIKADRAWVPTWRFAPLSKIDDAFLLLEASGGVLTLTTNTSGDCTAQVQVGKRTGNAAGRSTARVIVTALVAALELAGSR